MTGEPVPAADLRDAGELRICHNEDDHMQVAADPLAYYEARVDKADEITDWREQNAAAGKAEIE